MLPIALVFRYTKAGEECLKEKKAATKSTGTGAIEEAIRPFGIGEKLRGLRLRKSMGLAQLAAHTGLSEAMISKLENSRLVPTLPTLARIAMVFNVGLDYFFTDERKRHVVALSRGPERMSFPESKAAQEPAYLFESLNFRAVASKLQGYLAEFRPVPEDKAKLHVHPGVELLYLLQGTLRMRVGTENYRLEAGDAIYFESIQKHSYASVGTRPCKAVVVTCP
jgi:transcriptional regulator with XRE-family HTH domain